MPFTSIKSDAFVTGVAFGSVLQTFVETYLEKLQTEEQAEALFQRDRKYIMKILNNQEGYIFPTGPTSEKAKRLRFRSWMADGRAARKKAMKDGKRAMYRE